LKLSLIPALTVYQYIFQDVCVGGVMDKLVGMTGADQRRVSAA